MNRPDSPQNPTSATKPVLSDALGEATPTRPEPDENRPELGKGLTLFRLDADENAIIEPRASRRDVFAGKLPRPT